MSVMNFSIINDRVYQYDAQAGANSHLEKVSVMNTFPPHGDGTYRRPRANRITTPPRMRPAIAQGEGPVAVFGPNARHSCTATALSFSVSSEKSTTDGYDLGNSVDSSGEL
jgi:hypothetical protein